MIKLFKLAARSEPLVLRFCGPGHVLGLRSALAGRAYEDSAEAVEESVVCAIPLETFVSLLACSPGLAFSLIRKLANEALEGQERLIEFIHCGVMQRAANLLLTMREQLGGSRPGGAAPLGRLKRMDLASMIGTTPESMYRALHDLRERGVISVDRDAIRVLDSQKLRAIARVPKNP
jgi:CRP-like cAMP-binding protein